MGLCPSLVQLLAVHDFISLTSSENCIFPTQVMSIAKEKGEEQVKCKM